MNVLPRNVVSGFLFVSFLAVALTGILMFFKIRVLSTEAIHIWLGLGMVIIVWFHLVKNWVGFKGYFKKSSTYVALVVGILIIALFVAVPLLDNAPEKVNPKALVFKALMDQPLEKVAVFLDMDAETMLKRLSDDGHMVASARQSVSEIAKANDTDNGRVLALIF